MARSCRQRLLAITVILGAAAMHTTGLRVREEGGRLLGCTAYRTSGESARVETKRGERSSQGRRAFRDVLFIRHSRPLPIDGLVITPQEKFDEGRKASVWQAKKGGCM